MTDSAARSIRRGAWSLAAVAAIFFGAAMPGCGKKQPQPSDAAAPPPPSEKAAPAAPPAAGEAAAPSPSPVSGEDVYLNNCAECHMPDGSGVPNMQPALLGSPIVAGDPARLEAVIRAGSAALRDRQSDFQNEMPPFGFLSQDEVKAVMDYVRANFGASGAGGS